MKTLRAALPNHQRVKIQAAGTQRELRRQIGGRNVVGYRQQVRSQRTTHRQAHRVSPSPNIEMTGIGRRRVGRGAIAEIPKPVGNRPGRIVREGDRQRP